MRCQRSQLLLFFINRHQKLPLTRVVVVLVLQRQSQLNKLLIWQCVCALTRLTHSPCRIDRVEGEQEAAPTPDAKRRPQETLAATPCKLFSLISHIYSVSDLLYSTHAPGWLVGPRNVATDRATVASIILVYVSSRGFCLMILSTWGSF